MPYFHTYAAADYGAIDVSGCWSRLAADDKNETSDKFKCSDTTASLPYDKNFQQANDACGDHSEEHIISLVEDILITNATEKFLIATAYASTQSAAPLKTLLRDLREILGMDIAFVAKLVDGKKIYRHIDCANASRVSVDIGTSVALEKTLCQRVVDGRAPQFMNNVNSYKDLMDLASVKSMKIGAYLSTPVIFSNGSVFGTLCCISHKPRSALGSRQVDSLKHVARMIAIELEKWRD